MGLGKYPLGYKRAEEKMKIDRYDGFEWQRTDMRNNHKHKQNTRKSKKYEEVTKVENFFADKMEICKLGETRTP